MSGKGDKRRPAAVDFQTYSANWEAVFAKPDRTTCKHRMKVMFTDTLTGACRWRCYRCGAALAIEG